VLATIASASWASRSACSGSACAIATPARVVGARQVQAGRRRDCVVGPAPLYHWCPGEFWRPEWGFNFDWNTCHDDHRRDGDGDNHNNDFRRRR
jgi:hypothetical protein